MEDRTRGQTDSLDAEFGEPGPPVLELVELFDPIPELIGSQVEPVATPVGKDGRCHGSQPMAAEDGLGARHTRVSEFLGSCRSTVGHMLMGAQPAVHLGQ